MTTPTLKVLCAVVVVTAAAGRAAAQQAHPTRADVNGEWTGALELEGGTHNLSFSFRLTDSTFDGTVYDGGRIFGDMTKGSLSADTVKFFVDQFSFTGIMAGTKMKVALIVFNGSTRNFVITKKPTGTGGGDARRD